MGLYFLIVALVILIFIYLFKRDSYIYGVLFFYLILPDYCAISLGESLPTLTASRCILILLLITTCISKKNISFKLINKSGFFRYLAMLFLTETCVFFAHLDVIEHIKDYLGFIVENILFLVLFANNVDSGIKVEKVIDLLCMMTAIISVAAIIETTTGINIAEYFSTGANDSIMMVNYERLNVRRATFSLGHPICLAVYMGMLVPLIMYKIKNNSNIKYKLYFVLTLITIILTVSRGPIFIVLLYVMFYFCIMRKAERRKYELLIFFGIFAIIIVCLISDKVWNTIYGTFGSILKEFGVNIQLENFGANASGTDSRVAQWTAAPKVLEEKFLFGGGDQYIFREKVSYTRPNGDTAYLRSIDCEYLAVIIDKGIIGFIGYCIFYFGILKKLLFTTKSDRLKYFLYSYGIALLCYVTVCQLTTIKMFWCIIALIFVERGLLYIEREKENE